MRKYFYSIKTKRVSSKKICLLVNEEPSNQHKTICVDYEGGGIWVETRENPIALKHKLERILDIELGEPKI